ncbi:MAG: hypothetical protein WKG07_10695 [Hymenobacter sp.]
MELIDIPLAQLYSHRHPGSVGGFPTEQATEVLRLVRKNAGMLTWAFLPIIVGTIFWQIFPST